MYFSISALLHTYTPPPTPPNYLLPIRRIPQVVTVGLKQPLTVNRCSDEVAGKHSIETSKQLILSLIQPIGMELQRIDTRLRPSCLYLYGNTKNS